MRFHTDTTLPQHHARLKRRWSSLPFTVARDAMMAAMRASMMAMRPTMMSMGMTVPPVMVAMMVRGSRRTPQCQRHCDSEDKPPHGLALRSGAAGLGTASLAAP